MSLSEKLKQDHEGGGFGDALEGYSEEAERLELKVSGLQLELFQCYHHEASKQGASSDEASEYAKSRMK